MADLQRQTGATIAQLVGAESAFVTPGCGAALALSAAACMSIGDPARMEQLPDTAGIPNQFLLQARQRYHYQRCLTIFGGELVMVGDDQGTSAEQLIAAIGANTAAIHFFVSGNEDSAILRLEELVEVADRKGIPVIVDAAYQVFPLARFAYYTQSGASLVGFGAKYFGACNSTGILAGKQELVDAAFEHSFIGYETGNYDTLGRPLKLDRQEIVAVTVGLREWFATDHDARIAEHWVRAEKIMEALSDIAHLQFARRVEDNSLRNGVMLTIDEAALGQIAAGMIAAGMIAALKEGDPCIWTRDEGNRIRVAVAHLVGDEIDILMERLRECLTGS